MRFQRILGLGVVIALGVVFLPDFFPTGFTIDVDVEKSIGEGRIFSLAAVMFGVGLLTALTPCVYPLIPITVGIFGAGQGASRARAAFLTGSYVLGMVAVFSTLGVVAGMTGKLFGSALSNPWVIAGLAAFMLVLASSLFGAFDLSLPSGLATRLSGVGQGGLVGAFLMGTVAGFLAAPCTGPALVGLLTYVGKSQNPYLGAMLMSVYALGIGAPFVAIGVLALKLPRGGEWMDWVKSVFGLLLVGMAMTYVKDAFPAFSEDLRELGMKLGRPNVLLISFGLVLASILVGSVHRSLKSHRTDLSMKLLGVALFAVAIPVRGSTPAAGSAESAPMVWTKISADDPELTASFDGALAKAREEKRPVMIDFFADWCAACNELDRLTYNKPAVQAEAARFAAVKVDGTNENDALDAIYKRFDVVGLPTVVFIDSTGQVMTAPRVTGFVDAPRFVAVLKKVP